MSCAVTSSRWWARPMAGTSFSESQPARDFFWRFMNRDGSCSWYRTEMVNYHRFAALYGVPTVGRWAYEAPAGAAVC